MKAVLDVMPYPYLPYFSGGQKSIAQFLEYLAQETKLTVATVPGNDEALAPHYRIHPILKKGPSRYLDTSLAAKICELIGQQEIRTVIWEHPYYAWLAFRVRKRTGVKTIFHTHNIEYKRFRSLGKWWWPLLRAYERWCFRKADALFFIAPEERLFAETQWRIDPSKCFDVPFGVPISAPPSDRTSCANTLRQRHGIAPDEKILLFNGLLSYEPNREALDFILNRINPLLQQQAVSRYRILICGKGLSGSYNDLKAYAPKGVTYAGFVEDIETYFKGADLFMNPVQRGGGIKTKMVEALAFGTTVVTVQSGATGMDRTACGKKLRVVADNDWSGFASAVQEELKNEVVTPAAFYDKYFWGAIVRSTLPQLL